MLAVFRPSPDSGMFDDFRWPRGLVTHVSNEQASRLAQWEGVTLYRSGTRVAVVLRHCHDRPELYEIAASSKMDAAEDEPPVIPGGAEGLGLEHAGRVTVLPAKPTGPFVFKLPRSDEPAPEPERHRPDDMVTEENSVQPATAHEAPSGSDFFTQASFPCPVCGYENLASEARRERHLEMQHPEVWSADDEERAAIYAAKRAEQEARERIRRAGEKPPPPPVWDRELAGLPDDDREPVSRGRLSEARSRAT